jgi:hypothetical protein
MNTDEIILTIDAEISRLQHAKAILADTSSVSHAKRKPGRTAAIAAATSFNPTEFDAKPRKRRVLSAEARARIAAAQKARWAKFKKAAQ